MYSSYFPSSPTPSTATTATAITGCTNDPPEPRPFILTPSPPSKPSTTYTTTKSYTPHNNTAVPFSVMDDIRFALDIPGTIITCSYPDLLNGLTTSSLYACSTQKDGEEVELNTVGKGVKVETCIGRGAMIQAISNSQTTPLRSNELWYAYPVGEYGVRVTRVINDDEGGVEDVVIGKGGKGVLRETEDYEVRKTGEYKRRKDDEIDGRNEEDMKTGEMGEKRKKFEGRILPENDILRNTLIEQQGVIENLRKEVEDKDMVIAELRAEMGRMLKDREEGEFRYHEEQTGEKKMIRESLVDESVMDVSRDDDYGVWDEKGEMELEERVLERRINYDLEVGEGGDMGEDYDMKIRYETDDDSEEGEWKSDEDDNKFGHTVFLRMYSG